MPRSSSLGVLLGSGPENLLALAPAATACPTECLLLLTLEPPGFLLLPLFVVDAAGCSAADAGSPADAAGSGQLSTAAAAAASAGTDL